MHYDMTIIMTDVLRPPLAQQVIPIDLRFWAGKFTIFTRPYHKRYRMHVVAWISVNDEHFRCGIRDGR